MGILQRVMNLTRAAANEVLDKIESPAMMLNHYLRDMDEEIGKAEGARLQQQGQERVLGSKIAELKAQADYYGSKAEQAAAEGREEEARAALEAKLLYLEQADENARLQETAKQAAAELELRVQSLKEEKVRLQAKKEELIARMRKSGFGANDSYSAASPGSFQGSQAARGFERIEQKLMEWEAQRELAKAPYSGYRADGFNDPQAEQRKAHVEEQLKRLMNKSGQ